MDIGFSFISSARDLTTEEASLFPDNVFQPLILSYWGLAFSYNLTSYSLIPFLLALWSDPWHLTSQDNILSGLSSANIVLSGKFLPDLCYYWHLNAFYVRLLLLKFPVLGWLTTYFLMDLEINGWSLSVLCLMNSFLGSWCPTWREKERHRASHTYHQKASELLAIVYS